MDNFERLRVKFFLLKKVYKILSNSYFLDEIVYL